MLYNFPFAGPCPDQPKIGLSRDKFVISVDNFAKNCVNLYNGWQYTVVDKGDIVRGVNSPRYQPGSTSPPDLHIAVFPVTSDSSTLYMVYIRLDGLTDSVELYTIDGSVPNAVTPVYLLDIQQPVMNVPPDADQPGTQIKISIGDTRIKDAVWLQGKLWLTLSNVCRPEGDIKNRACFRLISIDTNSKAVVQNFDVGRRYSHFFPSSKYGL